MNFTEYKRDGHARYVRLAQTVRDILQTVIDGMPHLRLQHIMHRAKEPGSLAGKLERKKLSPRANLSAKLKDLAGCRVIFYTNDDVQAFVSSRAIAENFEVDWDRMKVHYTDSEEHENGLFTAYNYVLRLKETRSSLPEYADLKGLWCELQVQTMLEHAWSEMAHDTIYKKPEGGIGAKLIEDIHERMNKLMREHLKPAGYDFQKVSDDARRLKNAQAFMQGDPLRALALATDNDERVRLLKTYDELLLPLLDEPAKVAKAVRAAAVRAALDARKTAPLQHDMGVLSHLGDTRTDVLGAAVELLRHVRFADEESNFGVAIGETFAALATLAAEAEGDEEEKILHGGVEALARHNTDVWKLVGPQIQIDLLAWLVAHPPSTGAERRLHVAALSAMLSPRVSGSSSTSDTVTFVEGAVMPTDKLRDMRKGAIRQLEGLFDTSTEAAEQQTVIAGVMSATETPTQANYGAELLAVVLDDAHDVARLMRRAADRFDYEGLAWLEDQALSLRYRNGGLPPGFQKPELLAAQAQVLDELEGLREALCSNAEYQLRKAICGLLPSFDWDDEEWDFKRLKAKQEAAVAGAVAEMDDDVEAWTDRLREVLNPRSVDGAYFMPTQLFFHRAAKEKPEFILKLWTHGSDVVGRFLPQILSGLSEAGRAEDVGRIIEDVLAGGERLAETILYLADRPSFDIGLLKRCADEAIKRTDEPAVAISLEMALRRVHDAEGIVKSIVVPCIRALATKPNRWVDRFWFLVRGEIADAFAEEDLIEILDLLEAVPRLGAHEEMILAWIARRLPQSIFRFFERRIRRAEQMERAERREERYEAVPFSLHYLPAVLSAFPAECVAAMRRVYEGSRHFEYSGGRFVREIFKDLGPVIEDLLTEVRRGETGRKFVLDILRAYNGDPAIFPIAREVAARTKPSSDLSGLLEAALDENGVMHGEYGYAEAQADKRRHITPWLEDERPQVRNFAARYIRSLVRGHNAERRRATEEVQLRRRRYGEA